MTGFGKADPVEVEGAFKKCSEFLVMHDPFLQWHEFMASSGKVWAFDNADFLAHGEFSLSVMLGQEITDEDADLGT